ncbi:hypothetical protein [Okibacterium endophyticum]
MAAGILGVGTATPPAHAASETTDSAITVSWQGDTGPAAQFQPARDTKSIHYQDFENVTVQVSQTSDLVDQVVVVDVNGMPGATGVATNDGFATAYNFVQAMQCWGDPADPLFYETCQWGGTAQTTLMGALPVNNWTRSHTSANSADVPFRTAYGETLSSKGTGGNQYPYQREFGPATTNEVGGSRVTSDGTTRFPFAVQTADSAPHLGCGDASTTGNRCWLVIVPRGEHTGASTPDCPTDYYVETSSARGKMQYGSPVNPACGYWENRIVVPLDFQPTAGTCPPGSAERRTVGSPLIQAAMSSWQPLVCQGGATYSYNNVPDPVAREQLVVGQAGLAFTGAPVKAAELSAGVDPTVLDETKIVYAPVAVSAPVIAFYGVSREDGRIEGMKLTPRLVAKMLTQSYQQYIPWQVGEGPASWHNRGSEDLWEDPEFQAINPDSHWAGMGTSAPGLVLVLSGSDAAAQLWRWIQADDAARAFLAGEPDETGTATINPYYLPKGHPDAHVAEMEEITDEAGNLVLRRKSGDRQRAVGLTYDDGSPLCLCDAPLNDFPRADQTQAPLRLNGKISQTRRFETVQYNPPVNSFADAAANIQRLNKNMKTTWDPTAVQANGERGDYVTTYSGDASVGYLAGVTDSAFLERYGLSAAALQLPNRPGVFAEPTESSLSAALAAQTPTEEPDVTHTDFAKLPDDAFPLTTVTYAAVNLTTTDAAARTDYADLIEFASTTGQEPGRGPGELPPGYAPLSAALRDQAAAAVQTIREYVDPVEEDVPDGGGYDVGAPDGAGGPGGTADQPLDDVTGKSGETGISIDGPGSEVDVEATATEGSAATPIGLTILGGGLLLGASGAAMGPMLLRRRGMQS